MYSNKIRGYLFRDLYQYLERMGDIFTYLFSLHCIGVELPGNSPSSVSPLFQSSP